MAAEVSSLTVVIPHLNDPRALERCLRALHPQLCAHGARAIVVDNGSARPPTDVVRQFDGVELEAESRPGPGPARSRGAHSTSSPILAFIDADCIPAENWVESILGHFASRPETHVVGGDVRIQRLDDASPTAVEAYESIFGYRMKLYVERDHYTATCNMAVRREVFLGVGDFGGLDVAEDVDWGRRATTRGHTIVYDPAIRISTAARESFAELARKWDRQLAHEYRDVSGLAGHAHWLLRSLAMAISPMGELPLVMRSNRVRGVRERWLAMGCLARIRVHRARRMLQLLGGSDRMALARQWNRDPGEGS